MIHCGSVAEEEQVAQRQRSPGFNSPVSEAAAAWLPHRRSDTMTEDTQQQKSDTTVIGEKLRDVVQWQQKQTPATCDNRLLRRTPAKAANGDVREEKLRNAIRRQ
nr:hypothetical protein Iba_chr05fCG8240 [Ipomoea batatas]